jgi:hypothetical protein
MEYLAMEKPIVLSDINAHQSILTKNSNIAVYFNPDYTYDLGKNHGFNS